MIEQSCSFCEPLLQDECLRRVRWGWKAKFDLLLGLTVATFLGLFLCKCEWILAPGDPMITTASAPPFEAAASGPASEGPSKADAEALQRFRDFIRIPSISGEGPTNGAYDQCAEWLMAFCKRIEGCRVQQILPHSAKPVVIATLVGQQPSLPAIVLNSHYDVVPVMREHWSVDPFAAEIKEGYIGPQVSPDIADAGPCVYGRGAQDMKNVCCQYIEALLRLTQTGWRPLRTIHLTFVPDEEIGGKDGMGLFLQTDEFQALRPIAFALDEGLANPRDVFTVFYGERTPWWLLVRATGPTGHGSRFIKDTAIQKLMGVVNKALAFRSEQEAALGWDSHSGCSHSKAKKLGDVTTLNVNMLKSGVSCDGGQTYALNVIPSEAEAGFDVRICPSLATQDFKRMMDEWCADEGLTWKFAPWTSPLHEHHLTDTDRITNPFFAVFEDTCEELGTRVEREIFPAGTDSRFLRALGIQAIGFSPMAKTPILLHEHNEALAVSTFLLGIQIYEKIIARLADLPCQPGEKPQR
eukprot:gnl/TRDRNA2_/TRDRNA2_30121_c0_seq1.p1 gnl/TRDRNA2_/TRDRNA2_30121_c0~~gnl/TRDRNA2_/TRDRNA2_30121_c0_seq1.p1  ORF type:complete len:524 (-),score=65.56 gnl/TRDRNA2_/TRDRNA2_30121_c0_seq1:77-1648(-)